jgi:hypothetical protein
MPSEPRTAETPQEFQDFYGRVRELADADPEASPRDLETRSQRTAEFHVLMIYLRNHFGWEKGTPRIRGEAKSNTIDFLRRSGFFNAGREGRSLDDIWSALRDRLAQKTIEHRDLLILDGCYFPKPSFSIEDDYSIVRFSKEEIDSLGPAPDVVKTFFVNEQLDRDWHSQYWFLCKLSREKFPPDSRNFIIHAGDPALGHWNPLLLLGLYRVDCFSIPIIIESDWKWRLQRTRFSDTEVDHVVDQYGPGEDDYDVIPMAMHEYRVEDARHFREFLDYFSAPLAAMRGWKKNALVIAARRYLRATLMSDFHGDAPGWFDPDAYEDILLHYVYSLEALFSFGQGGFKDKVTTRGAWLAGGEDAERGKVRDLLSHAYDARSGLAHGGGSANQTVKLPELRRVVRDILSVYLALAGDYANQKELRGLIGSLALSTEAQEKVTHKRLKVMRLICHD